MRTSVMIALRRSSSPSAGVQTPSFTRAWMRVNSADSPGDMVAERRGVTLSTHVRIEPDHETTEVVAWENPRLRGHLIFKRRLQEGGILRKFLEN